MKRKNSARWAFLPKRKRQQGSRKFSTGWLRSYQKCMLLSYILHSQYIRPKNYGHKWCHLRLRHWRRL